METTSPIEKTSPKDVFLHLLAIITLYVSAINLGTLWFQYINVLFPDPLNSWEYYASGSFNSIRWSIASIIIVFPAFLITTKFLNKSYRTTPSLRNARIRKWLIYFTLFAAALIIIGDLVTLVFNLLGGEYTARFLLKVLSVLLISGAVFWYYAWDLKMHKTHSA